MNETIGNLTYFANETAGNVTGNLTNATQGPWFPWLGSPSEFLEAGVIIVGVVLLWVIIAYSKEHYFDI